jgi:hypothetical protein
MKGNVVAILLILIIIVIPIFISVNNNENVDNEDVLIGRDIVCIEEIEDYIKGEMNNPDSYEFISAYYWELDEFSENMIWTEEDKVNQKYVVVNFRQTNVYGGIVKSDADIIVNKNTCEIDWLARVEDGSE